MLSIKAYGINVAKLAKIPPHEVILRATDILTKLEVSTNYDSKMSPNNYQQPLIYDSKTDEEKKCSKRN